MERPVVIAPEGRTKILRKVALNKIFVKLNVIGQRIWHGRHHEVDIHGVIMNLQPRLIKYQKGVGIYTIEQVGRGCIKVDR